MIELRAWGKYWAIVRVDERLRVLEVLGRYEDLSDAIRAIAIWAKKPAREGGFFICDDLRHAEDGDR